jgi:hemerythrin-like domain-containing protein
MGALDALRHEHDVILDAVGLMEKTVTLPETQDIDLALCAKILIFLREYADRNHHAKEEDVLFPVMRLDPMLARLAELLEREHVEGRALVAAIERALMRPERHKALRDAVLDYVEFIRLHIAKENEMVFPAAERELSPSQADEIARSFGAPEHVPSF